MQGRTSSCTHAPAVINMVELSNCDACRDFERESAQAKRGSAPALERVRSAEATAEAAEQQVQAALQVSATSQQQLREAQQALRCTSP